MDTRFHCVYLLTSCDPKCPDWSYIGYTTDPLRRLRQHNGELVNGAKRTSRKGRPWRLVLCVSGFLEQRVGLKFEFIWQHPFQSNLVKGLLGQLRGLSKLNWAIGVLHVLLRTNLFGAMSLRLNIVDREKYDGSLEWVRKHKVPLFTPSVHDSPITVHYVSGQELQVLIGNDGAVVEGDMTIGREEDLEEAEAVNLLKEEQGLVACTLCALPVTSLVGLKCTNNCGSSPACSFLVHIVCASRWFNHINQDIELIPTKPIPCPLCSVPLHFSTLTQQLKQRINRRRQRSIADERVKETKRKRGREPDVGDALPARKAKDAKDAAVKSQQIPVATAALPPKPAVTAKTGSTTAVPDADDEDWLNW